NPGGPAVPSPALPGDTFSDLAQAAHEVSADTADKRTGARKPAGKQPPPAGRETPSHPRQRGSPPPRCRGAPPSRGSNSACGRTGPIRKDSRSPIPGPAVRSSTFSLAPASSGNGDRLALACSWADTGPPPGPRPGRALTGPRSG